MKTKQTDFGIFQQSFDFAVFGQIQCRFPLFADSDTHNDKQYMAKKGEEIKGVYEESGFDVWIGSGLEQQMNTL
jgi:hypothetical protein